LQLGNSQGTASPTPLALVGRVTPLRTVGLDLHARLAVGRLAGDCEPYPSRSALLRDGTLLT